MPEQPRVDSSNSGSYADERVSVRLGSFKPPREYNQPQLEPKGGIRTKEHEVLADRVLVQNLGEDVERFTLRGETYEEDIARLRTMKGDEVNLRHPIYTGSVLVKDVSATSTSSWDDVYGDEKWIYEYTIELLKVA